MTFITEFEKINPKVQLEAQKTTNSQGNSEQKQEIEGITKLNYNL
jgi:hypothetical protein